MTSKQSGDSTEHYYVEMESARNTAMDAYFIARPQILRTHALESIFRAGFERAFAMMWAAANAVGEVTTVETQPAASNPDAYLVEQPDGWRYLASTQQDAELTQQMKGGVIVPLYRRGAHETSETHPDTIRVEWLLRYVSGVEWRRLGAVYSAGMNRTALNDLMAPKEPTAFQDFVAGLPEEPKAPPRPQCDDCANAWPELCPRHLAAVKASGHPVMACIFRDGCRKFPACMTEDRCCGNDASIPKTR